MNENLIAERLIEHGRALFNAPRSGLVSFTGDPDADALTNDIERQPHAYVLANLMNQGGVIKAKRAWMIPYRISQKLGGFSMDILCARSQADILHLMTGPPCLHPYAKQMSEYFYLAVHRIRDNYGDDAARIWIGTPFSAEVVRRFREFKGVGPKIAHLAVNDLARRFKIPFADYGSIDISADLHIKRVFSRLGLCGPDPAPEQVIQKARSLHPEFPGLMDLPCWEIGTSWCKSASPECNGCYMKDVCATANRSDRGQAPCPSPSER